MAADSVNREAVRDAFATLAAAGLVGAGRPFQVVYGYKKGKFTESPVLLVFSGPIGRGGFGMKSERWHNVVFLHAWIFVADADEGAGWTEQNVDDKLDECEKELADLVADNRTNAAWGYLTFLEDWPPGTETIPTPSGPGPIPAVVDGAPYLLEQKVLVARVYDA